MQALFEIVMQILIEGTVEFTIARDQARAGRDDPEKSRSGFIDKQTLQDRRDDPVYKKNLKRLIERNRQFEETRNEPRS
jgi:hypothetical protein